MIEHETVKQSAELLRRIIRSIDKKLEYHLLDPTQEGRFLLGVTIRGRSGTVSLSSSDLLVALGNDARKNAIRQKIKSARDHLLSNMLSTLWGEEKQECSTKLPGTRTNRSHPFFIDVRREEDS